MHGTLVARPAETTLARPGSVDTRPQGEAQPHWRLRRSRGPPARGKGRVGFEPGATLLRRSRSDR